MLISPSIAPPPQGPGTAFSNFPQVLRKQEWSKSGYTKSFGGAGQGKMKALGSCCKGKCYSLLKYRQWPEHSVFIPVKYVSMWVLQPVHGNVGLDEKTQTTSPLVYLSQNFLPCRTKLVVYVSTMTLPKLLTTVLEHVIDTQIPPKHTCVNGTDTRV